MAPANSVTSAQPFAHFPLARLGENRRKARRLVDEDNDSLVWKIKAVCKKGNLFTTFHQQTDVSHSRESGYRASAHLIVVWEDKRCSHEHPRCLLLSQRLFLMSMMLYIWCGILLGSILIICPSCVPSQSLTHPQPTCWWERGSRTGQDMKKRNLDAVQALFSNSQNNGCLIHSCNHKYKAQHHTCCCEKN